MRIFTFLAVLFFPFLLAGQTGGLIVQNHLPKEYKGFNQMWQAAQDKNGLMYFGCTSNIFIYDGESWEKTPVKQGAATRQVLLDSSSGTIYVGSVGDFGYLEHKPSGKVEYVSLLSSLSPDQKVFSDIWKINIVNGLVYFQSSERIFVVKDKKVLRVIEAPKDKSFAFSFGVNNKFYVRQRNSGLMELQNNQLVLVPGGEPYGAQRIMGMIPWGKGKTLVLSGDQGFFVMHDQPGPDGSCFEKDPVITDDFLVNAFVLGCLWVNDSTIAVNSRSGIGFYTREGKLIETLDKPTGLSDGSIAALFLDREKNIWAMHNNGVSMIAYNARIRSFDARFGYSGTPETMYRYNGTLFLGTSEGLFRQVLRPDSLLRFEAVPDFRTETWSLCESDGDLLVCTSSGLYQYHDNACELITPYYSDYVCPASAEKKELVVLEKLGLSVIRKQANGKYALVRHYDLDGEELMHAGPVRPSATGKDAYDLWTVDRFKKVLHIQLGVTDSLLQIMRYDTANGLHGYDFFPMWVGDTLYVFSPRDCQRYVPEKDKGPGSLCFEDAPGAYMRAFNGNTGNFSGVMDSRLILEGEDNIAVTFMGARNNATQAMHTIVGNVADGNGMQNTFFETNGDLWALSSEILALIHTSAALDTSKTFQALIRSVKIGVDSALAPGTGDVNYVNTTGIDYRFNSIAFTFAVPYFMCNNKSQYVFRLDGFDTTWTYVPKLNSKEYTNLSEGTYTFRVIAYNSYGMRSQEASYTFTILPPWYRTGWAYAIYLVAFAGAFWLAVRLTARQLRKQKEKLEQIVNERTAEVVNQKQQIEIQKTELETAYTDIKDSIHYAKRIQEAILPVETEIVHWLPDSFIYFQPRDIVSGDFFWFTVVNGKSFIACVDCTGHGVPGALMSMIGNTLLNQVVREKKIDAPDLVLNELHAGVRQALKQDSGGETRDGMDIALCVIDHSTGMLSYAGANRPFWKISAGVFSEIKADKFSIAGDQMEEERRFHCHNLQLLPGDCVYLSSDGYADQFGGEKGKKFMVKRFQKLLTEIYSLPMNQQKTILENKFTEWKGALEQVDDVLVIGFRYIPTA